MTHHRPSIDGMMHVDDAIADVMRLKGMTRRNAVRFLRKAIRDGRLKTRVLDKRTLEDKVMTPQQTADLIGDDA